ncbi:hypothetical protein AVEN_166651-1 [Araneus ventricosus]|uniref:Uncharacterized protein n=1 Tax=Araneus ventricosus TaxID=182803 RepID=A0A4Y2DZR8_ARAVE|nr:hypothetical protein AVEN_166651-1 [Araneus ventricosus]
MASGTRAWGGVLSPVIRDFTKLVFRHIIEATNEPSWAHLRTNLTFRILKISLPHRCLSQDDRKYKWEGVTKRTLTFACKKLLLESVVECDFEGFETRGSTRLCLWPRSRDWSWVAMISMSLWKSTAKS